MPGQAESTGTCRVIKITGKIMTEIIDKSGIKFNQIMIASLVSLSFLFDLPWLLAFTSLIMITGSIFREAGLFRLIYLGIIKPSGIMKPHPVNESNAPHLFSHALGGIVLLTAFLLIEFLPGNSGLVAGWSLALIVAVLAFVNITLNFCAGCFLYFQLQKSGLLNSKGKSTHA
jgi:hypothetical protein